MKKLYIFILLIILVSNSLVYSQFGKNKVQYEEFDWKFINSPNFIIYYNSGSKYLAEFTAFSAEKALASLKNNLKFNLNKRIPLIVYNSHNQFQQSNTISSYMPEGVGGVTELFKNRIVLPFQGDYAQFDHVIHHELVHGYINDFFYGGTLRSAISSNALFDFPLWMNEGLAEYQSIGDMNTETDMFMRDLIVSEQLPKLKHLDGYLSYRGGQTFYWYVAENYGKDKILDLIHQLRINRNVDIAFKNVFKLDLDEFGEKWERDLKKYFLPDLSKYENPKDYATQITFHTKDQTFYNSSPTISPDGKKMVYISAPGGVFGIFIKVLDEKGEGEKIISSSRSQDFEDLNMLSPGISWDPSGKKIAISAKSGGEDAIYIYDVTQDDYERFRLGIKSISSVVWSPDGNSLAFIGSNIDRSDIYTYNLKTKKIINVTNDIFSEKTIIWSNDSKNIYFISDRDNYTNRNNLTSNFKIWNFDFYKSDIYKINVETSNITRITFDPKNNKTSLAINQDESKLLYVSDKNGIGNVYSLDFKTNEIIPLTNSLTGITQISLAKDNSKLLFTTQADGGYDIYMLKFPFDKKLNLIELPLTTFKSNELTNEAEADDEIKSTIDSLPIVAEVQAQNNYGEFEVTFDSQKLVEPNRNIIQTENSIVTSALSDTNSQFQEFDYKTEFSIDLAMTNPSYTNFYGYQGTSQIMISDIFGDHRFYIMFNLVYDLKNSQLFFAYQNLSNIIDYTYSLLHNTILYQDYNGSIFRFRDVGLGFNASYPFSLFDRLELSTDLKYLSKENIYVPGQNNIDRFLIIPSIQYVFDNTLWRFYGPFDGWRYFFNITASPKLYDQGAGFATFSTDIRKYLPIGNYMSLALRGAAAMSFGVNAQNFYMGGTENWLNFRSNYLNNLLDDPIDFAFMAFQMPLRGWNVNEISGNKFFLMNAEFRFPLLTALVAGPLPVLIQGINGAVFFDIGGAWTDNFQSYEELYGRKIPKNLLMSTGIGIRSSFLGIPLKIDVAWRNEYDLWSEPYWLFSIGYDF